MAEKSLDELIHDWLKFKDNYLFISKEFERDARTSNIFFSSSDFVSKKNFFYDYYLFDGKYFKYFKPHYKKRKKELSELFDQLEYVQKINILKNFDTNFSYNDLRKVLLFITEKSNSMKKLEFFRMLKNNNFTNNDEYKNSLYATYQKYQKDIFKYSFLENSDGVVFDTMRNELFTYCEELVNNLKFYIDNIPDEIGIFFPVKKIIDIFDTQEYLFEINCYKYKKRNFSNFTCSSDEYHGTRYSSEVAYFDPIILLNHYSQEFLYLYESLKCKEDIKLFIDKLNRIQFDAVILQQENLFNSIYSFRSKNRQMSLRELIQFLIKQIDLNINNVAPIYKVYFENKKNILLEMLKNKVLTKKYKNINIDELGFKDSIDKKDAEQIYNQLKFILKRNLKLFSEECIQDLSIFLDTKCSNNKENIHFIKKLVTYLITFDIDANIKLGNSYNSKFRHFYKNKKYNINNLYKILNFRT